MAGVLVSISTIAQLCHRAVAVIASVIRISLLIARIAVHVVAAQLPEAGLVALRELKTVHPLRRFPEVEMRHEQARRTLVLARQRLAFVLERPSPSPLRGRRAACWCSIRRSNVRVQTEWVR